MFFPDVHEASLVTVLTNVTAFFMTRSALAVAVGFWFIHKTRMGQTRRVYAMDFGGHQLHDEFWTILKIVPFYSVLVALSYYYQIIHYADFTVLGTLFTFFSIFIWNELWFYGLHRLLHTRKWMYIHATHHRARVTSPFSIACFSFAEQSFHVFFALIFPVLISRVYPITFEGLAFYSLFQITVNLLGHMNVEVYPTGFADSWIGRWVTTPTFHALHHGRSKGHYGLLTTIPDRIFGTYFEDYPRVLNRAAEGRGLTRLNERA